MPKPVTVEPMDAHNQLLVSNVHPADWINPTPNGRYNLVVIGAGTAGLITALVASSLGAKVALIERHLMGGDCLNVGCVPSKAVIKAARIVHDARGAGKLGLPIPDDAVPDFGAAMERMREIRSRISHEDSTKRYTDEFGIDVYLGSAKFVKDGVIDLEGTELRYKRAVVATGARAVAPAIPGLAEAGYLDNETIFTLTERPRRLGVIGAGPIGCELAQSFRRLGCEVTVFEQGPHILAREDADAAEIVQNAFIREGVELSLGCKLERVEMRGTDKVIHVTCSEGTQKEYAFDEILVGAGRAPNVQGVGLENVGVEFDERTGIKVDDKLRTTNKNIYGCGDVCMAWKFTHAADAAAKMVVQNALFFGNKKLSSLVMPWATYTDPEVAHVGMYVRDAKEKGIEVDTYQVPMERSNRAVTDGEEEGFVKVHVRKGTDKIVGATIVASHAGELITPFTLAINHGIGLGAFTNIIYPYPTQTEALKAAAGMYTRTRLTPGIKRIFETIMRWRR